MPEPSINTNITDANVVGVYADVVSLWHTPDIFVLDFATHVRPPYATSNDAGEKVPTVDLSIVSRVRIPPSQMFEIMKAMEQQLSAWERENARRSAGSSDSVGGPPS